MQLRCYQVVKCCLSAIALRAWIGWQLPGKVVSQLS